MSNISKNIEIVPYNPDWPTMFETEAHLIKEALGKNCVEIHHIGSTSVPELVAKPKIDILAVIKDPQEAIKGLASIGFDYKGEYNIPLHYSFSKRGVVDVNLHVYEEGHPEIELNLLFRNYLRDHPLACNEYASLKRKLLQDTTSFEKINSSFSNYTLRKGDFIRKILKQAGFRQLRMLKCNDETEWAKAQHFRQFYFFDQVPVKDPYTWTFHHPEHIHLMLYQGTDIIGYAHVQLWPQKRAALRIMVLEEEKRHHGYGGKFLSLIEKWLYMQGYQCLQLESSPQAYSFYKKYGYQEMPFDDPENHASDPQDIPMGKIFIENVTPNRDKKGL